MKLKLFKKNKNNISLENQINNNSINDTSDNTKQNTNSQTNLFKRLKKGLSNTRTILTTDVDKLFINKNKIDNELLESLEEILITADMGVQTTMEIISNISKKKADLSNPEQLKDILKKEILSIIDSTSTIPTKKTLTPHVILVIGINGVGKTTTIGKIAANLTNNGKNVILGAADTFRAAAIEQLTIWAEKAKAQIIKNKINSDPSAVAFNAVQAGIAKKADFVIVDTAGRIHTKNNLMEELKKIKRTITKKIPSAPHEVLLVLDATTGQNALSQAKLFNEAIGVSSIALTKLDGTAKGGIIVSIYKNLNIPVKYIGVGEKIEDLQPFDPKQFVEALF